MSKKLKKHTQKSVNPPKKGSATKRKNVKKTSASPKNNNIKEISIFLCYLLIPSILVTLSTLVFPLNHQVWLSFVYLTTLIGIVLFFLFKFHHHKLKILALLLGIALSPLYTLIHAIRTVALANHLGLGPSALHDPYFTTIFAFISYTVPFFFATGIVLIVALSLKARKDLSDENL